MAMRSIAFVSPSCKIVSRMHSPTLLSDLNRSIPESAGSLRTIRVALRQLVISLSSLAALSIAVGTGALEVRADDPAPSSKRGWIGSDAVTPRHDSYMQHYEEFIRRRDL